MQRRDFLKTTAILGAVTAAPSLYADSFDTSNRRVFDVTFRHAIKESGKFTRLWVPIPMLAGYQTISDEIKISGNFTKQIHLYGDIPTVYAEFDGVSSPILDVNFQVSTFERNTDFSKVKFDESEVLTPNVAKYLASTAHIKTDGVVKQKADEIIAGVKGDLERARAIYEWVATHMQRDESVVGCGLGDAAAILSSGKLYGKCTDINSVFVALCRAVGIPAREIFGIRVGASRMSGAIGKADEKGLAAITGGQHCRAEFYLKGYGWIPVDPADVAKVRLAEKLSLNDSKFLQVKEFLFGNWEMCWVGFNTARDFILEPKPAQFPINNFGYPYAEVDENVVDYYNAKEFSYSYSSQEIKI